VCKYIVPQWYPQQPIKWWTINIDKQNMQDVDCFFWSVEQVGKDYITLWSRAIAIIAHGNDLNEAEQKVEKAIQHISGPISYRKDIWTQKSMNEKINIMNRLRK
jgi:phosphoribosylamine-glycine ligase